MAKIYDAVLKLSSDPFVKGLEKAEAQMESFRKKAGDLGRDFNKSGKLFASAGSTLTKAITLPAVAAGTMAVKSFMDFEDAMAGVRKTVDATPEEFNKVQKGLEDMSKQIPVSVTDLANIAEQAGQLGIATENIVSFTRTVADLSVATNLGEEGAAQMAKFANITGMSQKDFDRLGSTIVELGNNFATTERDIMNMGMRLGAAGSQVGMSQADIMGLSTALSSVGIEAEAGGSAMSKVLINMSLAAETGGESLDKFANATHMSGEAFKNLFKSDPTKALQTFIKSLGDAEKKGTSAIVMLDEMGISEVRMRDSLLRAAGAADMFSEAQVMANEAWKSNAALSKEAETKYGTLISTLKILKNNIFVLGKTFGGYLAPYVKQAAEYVKGLVDRFNNLSDDTKKTIARVVANLALLGPSLLGIGFVLKKISKGFSLFKDISTMVKDAGGIMKLILSPAGKVVLVLMGLALVASLIINNWSKIKDFFNKLFPHFNEQVEMFKNKLVEIGQRAIEIFSPVVDALKSLFDTVSEFVVSVILPLIVNALGTIKNVWEMIWPILSSVIETFVEIVSIRIQAIIGVFDGIITFLTGVFTGNWSQAWEGVKKIFSSVWTGIRDTAVAILDSIIDKINTVTQGIGNIKIPDWVPFAGGKNIGIPEIPKIGKNAMGTSAWTGGLTQINERGGEVVDLPRGTRILPHDKSVQEAYRSGMRSTNNNNNTSVAIPKLADTIVVREDADIDRIADSLYKKLKIAKYNTVGV